LLLILGKQHWQKKAHFWLQIRPGTDDALALSMLNVIINEKIYDGEFVDKWTVGFEQLKERVQAYPPEWAEKSLGFLRVKFAKQPGCLPRQSLRLWSGV
jgi:anaerobic selenocysteine-containing dehydrogenase